MLTQWISIRVEACKFIFEMFVPDEPFSYSCIPISLSFGGSSLRARRLRRWGSTGSWVSDSNRSLALLWGTGDGSLNYVMGLLGWVVQSVAGILNWHSPGIVLMRLPCQPRSFKLELLKTIVTKMSSELHNVKALWVQTMPVWYKPASWVCVFYVCIWGGSHLQHDVF